MKFIITVFLFSLISLSLGGLEFSEDTWISSRGDFSFKLPFDDYNYTIVEEAYNQEGFYQVTIDLDGKTGIVNYLSFPSVTFTVEPIDIIRYEDYFSYASETISYYSDLDLIDSGEAELNGIKALWVSAQIKPGEPFNSGYFLQIKQYYLLEPNPTNPIPRAYFITYVAPIEDYENYRDDFEEIVQSFTLL